MKFWGHFYHFTSPCMKEFILTSPMVKTKFSLGIEGYFDVGISRNFCRVLQIELTMSQLVGWADSFMRC